MINNTNNFVGEGLHFGTTTHTSKQKGRQKVCWNSSKHKWVPIIVSGSDDQLQ
jgi:hypothetical protein